MRSNPLHYLWIGLDGSVGGDARKSQKPLP
jgi:hypothetical protein